jgi:hypothetical protein
MKTMRLMAMAATGLLLAAGSGYGAPKVIGYWPFEEGTGTTTKDLTRNNPDATLANGAQWNTVTPTQLTHSAGSVDTLGYSTQHVDIGNPVGLDGAPNWSLSVWVGLKKANNYWNNWFGIVTKRGSWSNLSWVCRTKNYNSNNAFAFWFGPNGAGLVLDGFLTGAGWTHIVLTKADANYTLYVNGTQQDAGIYSVPLTTGDRMALGLDGWDTGASGPDAYFDDLCIWDGALTADDVTRLWEGLYPLGSSGGMVLVVR